MTATAAAIYPELDELEQAVAVEPETCDVEPEDDLDHWRRQAAVRATLDAPLPDK